MKTKIVIATIAAACLYATPVFARYCGFNGVGEANPGTKVSFGSGSFATPARTGANGAEINDDIPKRTWFELRLDGTRAFTFRETIVEVGSTTLYDDERDVYIKLDRSGGKIMYWQSGGAPSLLYDITALTALNGETHCNNITVKPNLTKLWNSDLGQIDWSKGHFAGVGVNLVGSLSKAGWIWVMDAHFDNRSMRVIFAPSGKTFDGIVTNSQGLGSNITGSIID